MLIVIIVATVVVVFFGIWAFTYRSDDPKGIKYVLWKAGLYRMDLDQATGAMGGDPNRDELVVGKTKAQLRDEFGLLLSPAEASQYLRTCYSNSPWREKEVLFLRQSPWMVIFREDKATALVLIKDAKLSLAGRTPLMFLKWPGVGRSFDDPDRALLHW